MKLKSAVAIMFALPVVAFGGTTCFKATSPVPASVRSILCLQGIVEADSGRDLIVVSQDGSFPSTLQITDFSRHNEDRIKFTAVGNLVDVSEGTCGYSFQAKVIVKSEIAYGSIDLKSLKVTVETEEMNDNCHSYPSNDVIEYAVF